MNKQFIKSYKDLYIYTSAYSAMLSIFKNVLPFLPEFEKFDLKNQLSRSSKAIPRLIAEGYGKRYQRLGFQRYLDDSLGECNETMVSLEQCKDIYNINPDLVNILIQDYDRIGCQIYCLKVSWDKSKHKHPSTLNLTPNP